MSVCEDRTPDYHYRSFRDALYELYRYMYVENIYMEVFCDISNAKGKHCDEGSRERNCAAFKFICGG